MSDIYIEKGSIYRDTLRWATSQCVLVEATLVPGAPVRFSAPSHGLVDGWSVYVETHRSFSETERHTVTVVDANTIELACVNGIGFRAGPAAIRYRAPVDMTGFAARQQIRHKTTGVLLLELLSTGVAGEPRIIIDNTAKTIQREIPASVTEDIDWSCAEFDLEMYVVADTNDVTKIDAGDVFVSDEVTR